MCTFYFFTIILSNVNEICEMITAVCFLAVILDYGIAVDYRYSFHFVCFCMFAQEIEQLLGTFVVINCVRIKLKYCDHASLLVGWLVGSLRSL